jgi:ribonuclease BN (tRNA processing enzyme)
VELGQLAARIRPKLLILSHIIRRGATDEELLAGVHRAFNGRVVVGHDLERY